MFGKALKAKAKELQVAGGGHHETIQKLIGDGFFDRPVSSEEVATRVSERSGSRLGTNHVQTYLKKFLQADILHGVKPNGSRQSFWVLASVSRSDALAQLGKSARVRAIQEELFSSALAGKLRKDFSQELDELRDNFGRHGNSTAFLLRKMLEKLLIITFAKNGKEHLLEDKTRPGGYKGLAAMIDIAASEKRNGVPFLTPRTAREIKGIKFLGDTAAHNPKVSVAASTVTPQMPYIVTAYEELASLL